MVIWEIGQDHYWNIILGFEGTLEEANKYAKDKGFGGGVEIRKSIEDFSKELKFVCPGCGGDTVQNDLDGYHRCEVEVLNDDGDFEYGQIYSEGETIGWACASCGLCLTDEDGEIIVDNLDLVKWIKKNCPQD